MGEVGQCHSMLRRSFYRSASRGFLWLLHSFEWVDAYHVGDVLGDGGVSESSSLSLQYAIRQRI